LILANIYAPNWDDVSFIKKFLTSFSNLTTHKLILGGDFNCVLHPTLDRSSKTPYNITKSAMFINTFLETYTFSDPWRFLYPNLKQFSFFSPVHRSYSQIDYFLIDDKLLTSVTDFKYESIVISDHSPVVLKLVFPKSPVRKTWRFNNFILSDSSFVDLINNRIYFFLSINDTSDVSKATLWESLKAYIRGEII